MHTLNANKLKAFFEDGMSTHSRLYTSHLRVCLGNEDEWELAGLVVSMGNYHGRTGASGVVTE